MSYLYGGSILFIDLSEGKVRKEPTSSYSKDFLGGRGINIKLLYDSVAPGTDAFDPSNLITFGTGPFTGTTCPASGRTDIMAKSPVTGLQGDSNAPRQLNHRSVLRNRNPNKEVNRSAIAFALSDHRPYKISMTMCPFLKRT